MKQTVVWLALALVFAIGASLSIIADSFGPAATVETAAPATLVEAPQPVVAASAKPAEPLVPVVLLDDVPPKDDVPSKSAASPEALARWFVAPGAPPSPRAAEALLTPLPLAPATTVTIAAQPAQDSKAGIKPLEADARPTRKPQNSNAQMPAKRRTANTKACGSSSRWTDLLRRLNLASRCPTKRSAA